MTDKEKEKKEALKIDAKVKLKDSLGREPTPQEEANMMTDAGLMVQVLWDKVASLEARVEELEN